MTYALNKDTDGILRITLNDQFTEAELEEYMNDLNGVLIEASTHTQLMALVDTTGLERVHPTFHQTISDFVNKPTFEKTAVLGNSHIIEVMTDFVSKTSKNHKIKYFVDQDKAITWLKNKIS